MAFVGMSEKEAERRGIPHVAAKVVLSNYALGFFSPFFFFFRLFTWALRCVTSETQA
jgi:hypothetical protein